MIAVPFSPIAHDDRSLKNAEVMIRDLEGQGLADWVERRELEQASARAAVHATGSRPPI